MTTDCVNLIDEDNTGRLLFRLVKHVTDTRCTHADEHFDEIRAGYAEKWHARFTRNRFGEQGFTRTGRANEQDAVRNVTAEFLEFLRVFEEVDDFFDFLLGFVTTGYVAEVYFLRAVVLQTGAGFAHRHHAVFSTIHLAHHEEPQPDQQQNRQQRKQQVLPEACAFDLAASDLNVVIQQCAHQRIVARRDQSEFGAVVWRNGQLVTLDFHFFDFVGFDLGYEFAVAHLRHFAFARVLHLTEGVPYHHQAQCPK